MFLILNMKGEKIVENIMQEEVSRRDFFKKAAALGLLLQGCGNQRSTPDDQQNTPIKGTMSYESFLQKGGLAEYRGSLNINQKDLDQPELFVPALKLYANGKEILEVGVVVRLDEAPHLRDALKNILNAGQGDLFIPGALVSYYVAKEQKTIITDRNRISTDGEDLLELNENYRENLVFRVPPGAMVLQGAPHGRLTQVPENSILLKDSVLNVK